MLSRFELGLAVAHASLVMDHAFYAVNDFDRAEQGFDAHWKDVRVLPRVSEPIDLSQRAFVVVEGDVSAECRLSAGGVLFVLGLLRSTIRAKNQSQIILAGDLSQGASIRGEGITSLFVGGDVLGDAEFRGQGKVWVEGHLRGRVRTGKPSAHLSVRGDSSAEIQPAEVGALLYLQVDGFMPFAALESIEAHGYTEFGASIGSSDRPAGRYPEATSTETARYRSRHNHWVIRSQAAQRS